jgi:hypothetical protein
LETDSGVIINPKAGQVDHFLKSDIWLQYSCSVCYNFIVPFKYIVSYISNGKYFCQNDLSIPSPCNTLDIRTITLKVLSHDNDGLDQSFFFMRTWTLEITLNTYEMTKTTVYYTTVLLQLTTELLCNMQLNNNLHQVWLQNKYMIKISQRQNSHYICIMLKLIHTKVLFINFKECILLCVSTTCMSFRFSCQTQQTLNNSLTFYCA